MVSEKISLEDLNPNFFAYGSFPIYLLKIFSQTAGIIDPTFSSYISMNLVGRILSVFFDLGTVFILFLLGAKIFNKKVGLLASFFYSISVLPIQLAHFYAVDTPLTFFILLTLYLLIKSQQNFSFKNVFLVGLALGLALSTKISAVLLVVPILVVFILKIVLDKKFYIIHFALLVLSAFTIFAITMPFALIDFKNFWQQTLAQQEMTKSAFTFPYTLQYVGKISYLYELKNIFFWGLGPILATLAFVGTLFTTYKSFTKPLDSRILILVTFFWLYFLVTGKFAIGFMRYMLPLYPLLCLFAAFFIFQLINIFKRFKISRITFLTSQFSILILLLIWPLSFLSIYSQPNSRVTATDWILQNIPAGSSLALEHWDDGLPLSGQSNYQILTLPLYDPDTSVKWQDISQTLQKTDYIIIASNRLYTPLQKLTDCQNLPPGRCYKQTADYYQKLFQGSLGFERVAQFSVLPTIPILNIPIDDFDADESFTVNDHPKVMIFKK
ncbi:MAG: glycosyltransferase family 39 protein [Candidatus Daviesbacteria bacterium]